MNPGRQPIGLGMRVPAIIVSPWSRGGWVCSEVFDHISTLLFMETRFGVKAANVSDWRRAVCGNLTSAFDFKNPNRDWTSLTLPDTADYLARIARSARGVNLTIPDMQTPTSQDVRQRHARPLPYELHADGFVEEDGRFVIEIANTGRTGAVFQIYDYTDAQGPWRYTIEANKRYVASPWHKASTAGGYDLAVHGPNGLYRHYRNESAVPGSEVMIRAEYDATRGEIAMIMKNCGTATQTFHVAQADIYALDSTQLRRRSYRVHPGSDARVIWTLGASDRWYDLSVTISGNGTFLHRYAGYVETGEPGMTDPAIGPMRV